MTILIDFVYKTTVFADIHPAGEFNNRINEIHIQNVREHWCAIKRNERLIKMKMKMKN